MFCRNCGNKMEDGQQFCANCGTKVGETSGQAPVQAAPQAEPQAVPQTQEQVLGQATNQTQYQNNAYVNMVNQGNTQGNAQNQKKLISVIGAVALVVLLIIFVPKMLKGVNSSAEAVAKATFSAISKEDVNAFLKLIDKDDLKEFNANSNKNELKDKLKEINASVKSEYGKDWAKKVVYGTPTAAKSPSSDYEYFKIRVTMEGEDSYLYIKKIGSKYYLDPGSL